MALAGSTRAPDPGVWPHSPRAAQADFAANYRRVAVEPPAPDRIGKNDCLVLSALVLLVDKKAAEMRTHAQYVEKICRNLRARNELGTAFSNEAHRGIAIRADALERMRLLPPFQKMAEIDRQRLAVAELRRGDRDGYQPLRIGIIERAQ